MRWIAFSIGLVILIPLILMGCSDDKVGISADASPDATSVDCSLLTYENFGRAFIEDYCLECHHSELAEAERNDAPLSIDFETYDLVSNFSISIKAIAGTRPLMPPSFAMAVPNSEERANLVQWIDCRLP